jgi:cation:H+ antiporter
LLAIYLWLSITWTRQGNPVSEMQAVEQAGALPAPLVLLKLLCGLGLVVASSWILIPAVREAALRLHIPPSIIAATLVAFGTSLPELVTSVTAARRGYGELAVGNVVGADILNVLFVSGAAAAVTAGGLIASAYFFRFLFPTMLFVLIVFRIGIFTSGATMRRPFGVVLLGTYILITILSYGFRSEE